MKGRAADLQRRRDVLQARSNRLRLDLALQGQRVADRLAVVDTGMRWVQAARGKPWVAALGAAALLYLRPGRLVSWTARAALLTTVLRNAMSLYRSVRASRGAQPPDRFAS
ncbi:MAG: YqjK-like protein [Pseudomonadota bacterium]|jgi:hypothetical protein